MDLILSYNNNERVLVFPVVPNDGITVDSPQANGSFEAVSGEVNTIGRMGLRSMTVESFFPCRVYPWMRPRASADGWSYVEAIEAARRRAIPFRVIWVDGSRELLNMACTVDSFSYSRDKAGDVAYSLTLREYRF